MNKEKIIEELKNIISNEYKAFTNDFNKATTLEEEKEILNDFVVQTMKNIKDILEEIK